MIRVNGEEVGRTTTAQDSFSGTWSATNLQLIAGSRLEFIVLDDDPLETDDVVLNCSANPITADLLRGREFGCGMKGSEVHIAVRLEPQ